MIYLIFVSLISMSNAEYTFGMRSCEEADEKETFANTFKGAAATDCASYCLNQHNNTGKGVHRYRCFVDTNDKKSSKDKISAMLDVLDGSDVDEAVKIIRSAKDLETAKKELSARFESYSCNKSQAAYENAKREYETAQDVLSCKSASAKQPIEPKKENKTNTEQ